MAHKCLFPFFPDPRADKRNERCRWDSQHYIEHRSPRPVHARGQIYLLGEQSRGSCSQRDLCQSSHRPANPKQYTK